MKAGTLEDWKCRRCQNRAKAATPSDELLPSTSATSSSRSFQGTSERASLKAKNAGDLPSLNRSSTYEHIDSDSDGVEMLSPTQHIRMFGTAQSDNKTTTVPDLSDTKVTDDRTRHRSSLPHTGPKTTGRTAQRLAHDTITTTREVQKIASQASARPRAMKSASRAPAAGMRAQAESGTKASVYTRLPSESTNSSTSSTLTSGSERTSRQSSLASNDTLLDERPASKKASTAIASRESTMSIGFQELSMGRGASFDSRASDETLQDEVPRDTSRQMLPPSSRRSLPRNSRISSSSSERASASAGPSKSPSTGSQMPDFRTLIGVMRAQGKFNLNMSSYERDMNQFLTGPMDTRTTKHPAEDSDGDVAMADERRESTFWREPSDLESLYGDEAPPRRVKEEAQEQALPQTLIVPTPEEEDSRTLIAAVNRSEKADEPDGWVRALRAREKRLSQRHAQGILLPRKSREVVLLQQQERRSKAFDLVQTQIWRRVDAVGDSHKREWQSGIEALEHLFR